MLRPDLDAVRLVMHVEHALLDLVVDLPRSAYEGLLHVGRRLSAGLHEDEAVLPRERLALLPLHLPPPLQVTLVANKHDDHVGVGVLAGVLQPLRQVLEGVPSSDVVHQQRPGGPAVVGPRDGPKRLLTRRVPDLELDLLGVDGDHAGPELHSNGEVVHGLEALVGELQQKARLAHACITYNDIFE